MPRNMSFSMTTKQYRDRTKTQTRRCGWWFLKAGDVCNGVEKAQGLKKGEKIVVMGQHRIASAVPERLDLITQQDLIAEGFPELTPMEFIEFFCAGHRCTPETIVNKIVFEYID